MASILQTLRTNLITQFAPILTTGGGKMKAIKERTITNEADLEDILMRFQDPLPTAFLSSNEGVGVHENDPANCISDTRVRRFVLMTVFDNKESEATRMAEDEDTMDRLEGIFGNLLPKDTTNGIEYDRIIYEADTPFTSEAYFIRIYTFTVLGIMDPREWNTV